MKAASCHSRRRYKAVDYQAIRYYSAPKMKEQLGSLDDVDPEVLKTFEKLGISLNEQARGSLVQPPLSLSLDHLFLRRSRCIKPGPCGCTRTRFLP